MTMQNPGDPSAVSRAVRRGRTVPTGADATIPDSIFERFSRKVRPLVPFCGDGMAHVFETMAEEMLMTPIESDGDRETAYTIVGCLREASEIFSSYADRLEANLSTVTIRKRSKAASA
jgi:hypothetical protein